MTIRRSEIICLAILATVHVGIAQQIAVDRIEQMPNRPSPYLMRDWKAVARGYDSLAFNPGATGQYLPLVWLTTNTVNYPDHVSFAMPSYVGSKGSVGEAINCLPAVIGATLCGIDKSNQNSRNWVLMCEEWFNNRPAENVYLNLPSASSGDDWWYETMPNVFFYQLFSLYPNTGDFSHQFTTVADRWLAAIRAMGGSATPWRIPDAEHRAWSLSTMTPTDGGVVEPEAAGAIGWVLYQAFVRTGEEKYRIGAEWALEYLNNLQSNPSYELQLSYGTYVAARMNAELGTTYDVGKMVNWCFDIGPLRKWGAMTDRWFGYDCAGLIGEVNGVNNYAFAMNTFEQVGTLVPLARYDARFARAIGKWVLNAANAARLFYSNSLPDEKQDSRNWTQTYDPNAVVSHEALRQYKSYISPYENTPGPFATGDAVKNDWASTNLGLYGSSHIGILGAIIDTTNVPMILRLDVLKTDYFHQSSYPAYLYFNPDTVQHFVDVDVGGVQRDIYDAVTHAFLLHNARGTVSLPIETNAAVLIVLTPAGGTASYEGDKLLVNGVVVDFHSNQLVANYPPRIKSLAPDSSTVPRRGAISVYCTAVDRNNDTLAYIWSASGGSLSGNGAVVCWQAPDSAGSYIVTCTVSDGHGGQVVDADTITVVTAVNHPPVIRKLRALPRKINIGASTTISCLATDPDSDALTYQWSAAYGVLSGSGSSVGWQAPGTPGNYYVGCAVADGQGGIAADSIGLEIRDFSKNQTGSLVAFYPFRGNANDASGNHHDGTVTGAVYTADRFGNPASAMVFDGTTTSVVVPNDSSLNFQNGIAVSFWMKVHAFYSREQYPISHGSWQNRWKVSISNGKVRWTVKTANGTKDLDSETSIVADSLYCVAVAYNGSDVELYLNGELDAFTSWSGKLLATSYALTIGQALPGVNAWNFDGVLDDTRIYDYALSVQEILSLYDIQTSALTGNDAVSPREYCLQQNFPNPFNPTTTIRFTVPVAAARTPIRLEIVDVLGRTIDRLIDGEMNPGLHVVVWHAGWFPSGVYYCRLTMASGTQTRKMVLLR